MFRRVLKFARRRKGTTAVLLVLLCFLPTPIIIAGRTWADHPDAWPRERPTAVVPERQTEPHTCGLHALNSLYRAYGLDPEAERLRFRVGVDVKAVFWIADSTGTLPPDLYMVLSQDHFHLATVDLEAVGAVSAVEKHLSKGHLAVFLIVRPETGGLHWVLGAPGEGRRGRIRIIDSLRKDPVVTETAGFIKDCVVSAVLVRPAGAVRAYASDEAHKIGAAELLRVRTRLKGRG